MADSLSEKKLAENEVIFRQANEKVQKGLKELRDMAATNGQTGLYSYKDTPLHYYCECADEDCRQRIVMTSSKYNELHQNSSQFILLPGHEIPSIERIMVREQDYIVVEKFITPPKKAVKLNRTKK